MGKFYSINNYKSRIYFGIYASILQPFYQLPRRRAQIQCIAWRGARGRTGVFEGLTLMDSKYMQEEFQETILEKEKDLEDRSIFLKYLIGKDPNTTPLQLRAAVALSACKVYKQL